MATPNQFTAPPANEYGGDEVSALVLDPGYSTVRAGFAGEDTPKSVLPSYYGVIGSSKEPLFGENNIHYPASDLEIHNPFDKSGIVQDWEAAAKLWEYAITSRLTGQKPTAEYKNGLNEDQEMTDQDVTATENNEKPLSEAPLLMSEPSHNPLKAREKTIEIAMEDWGAPAFWSGRTGAMAAFSAGKATALVIDIGASGVTVTPVSEGMVLKKGTVRSPMGGNWMSEQIRLMFAQQEGGVRITPHFMVAAKTPVDAGTTAQATLKTFKTPPTDSYKRLQEERVLTEFKESVVQVWEGPGRLSSGSAGASNEEIAKSQPGRPFEMPDGWNQVFGIERFKVAEGLFDPKAAYTDAKHPAPNSKDTLGQLILTALQGCDVDLRPTLLNNIVLVGAGSQYVGLSKRINTELDAIYPGPKVRMFAPGNTAERKFASWIGGSILASLGSFHQMWISQKEYQEHGASIIEKRCK